MKKKDSFENGNLRSLNHNNTHEAGIPKTDFGPLRSSSKDRNDPSNSSRLNLLMTNLNGLGSLNNGKLKAPPKSEATFAGKISDNPATNVFSSSEDRISKNNGNFLSNLSKLKEINSKKGFGGEENLQNRQNTPVRINSKALSAFGGLEDRNDEGDKNSERIDGIFSSKRSPMRISRDKGFENTIGQGFGGHFATSNEPQNGSARVDLEEKKVQLKGRLNDLLDKLAVSGPGGETRSVAPVMQRQARESAGIGGLGAQNNDDNLSMTSFQSMALSKPVHQSQTIKRPISSSALRDGQVQHFTSLYA